MFHSVDGFHCPVISSAHKLTLFDLVWILFCGPHIRDSCGFQSGVVQHMIVEHETHKARHLVLGAVAGLVGCVDVA